MNDTLALVVTSERTWPNLATYCFNENFLRYRPQFDLAVVLNGPNDAALQSIAKASPDFVFVRPNYGLDPADFDFLLKRIPLDYEYYCLLHDDHWFHPSDWFLQLRTLAAGHLQVDVFGNLVRSNVQYHPSMDGLSKLLGYDDGYSPDDVPFFIQGMAGLYRKAAINTLLSLDGIPHLHRNVIPVAWLAERLVTAMLWKRGHSFMQIPPGYERFLRHKNHDPLRDSAYTPSTPR